MKKTRVIILFGGRSAEHEISLLSARNVLSALDRDAVRAGADRHRQGRALAPRVRADAAEAAAGDPAARCMLRRRARRAGRPWRTRSVRRSGRAAARPALVDGDDVVFPVLHGTFGEDGTVQGAARAGGRRLRRRRASSARRSGWTRTSPSACCAHAGIPVVDFAVVTRGRASSDDPAAALARVAELGYPLLVKPANAGSSVGVSRGRGPRRSRARGARGARVRQQGAGRARGRRARDRVRGAGQRRSPGVDPRRDRRHTTRTASIRTTPNTSTRTARSFSIPAELPPADDRARVQRAGGRDVSCARAGRHGARRLLPRRAISARSTSTR